MSLTTKERHPHWVPPFFSSPHKNRLLCAPSDLQHSYRSVAHTRCHAQRGTNRRQNRNQNLNQRLPCLRGISPSALRGSLVRVRAAIRVMVVVTASVVTALGVAVRVARVRAGVGARSLLGVLHLALVVRGHALHHLAVAVAPPRRCGRSR